MLSLEIIPIDPYAVEGIRTHAQREQAKGNYEAVGFMAKSRKRPDIHVLAPMHNHSSNPTDTFFVEPWLQYKTERELAERGLEIVGVYHSHPTSEAIPSRTDQAMARPREVVAIFSVVFDELRLYRERDGQLEPIGWEHP